MFRKVTIDDIRKPACEIISIFTICIVLFTSLLLFNGLEYSRIPNYLKYSTLINIIISILGLLQWIPFVKINKDSTKSVKKHYALFLSIVNVLSVINMMGSFTNLYYYMGIQHGVDLYSFWLFNHITLILSFLMICLACNLMFNEFRILPRKRFGKKHSKWGLIVLIFAQFPVITKPIEYFNIVDIADSKFIIIGSLLALFPFKFAVFLFVKKYIDYKIHEKIMVIE